MKLKSSSAPKVSEPPDNPALVIADGDPERGLLNAFLSANAAEQEKLMYHELDPSCFETHEAEFGWLAEFFERHRRPPTLQAFRTRFRSFKFNRTTDPIDYYLAEITSRRLFDQVRKMSQTIHPLMEDGSPKSMGKVAGVIRDFSSRMEVSDTTHDLDYKRSGRRRLLDYKKKKGVSFVCDTPWDTLNDLIIGLEPEDVVSIIARPAIGKTWFVVKMAHHIWHHCEKNVVFFTKEMSEERLSRRFDAIGGKVNYERMRAGRLLPQEQIQIERYVDSIEQHPSKLVVSGDESFEGKALEDVYSRIQRYRPDIVFIDGAYLLAQGTDIVRGIVQLSRAVKRMAKVCRIPVVQVFQTNRQAEAKGGETGGGLAAVAWGDAIVADSDLIMELHGKREEKTRMVSVLKSRESGTGEFGLRAFSNNGVPLFSEDVAQQAQAQTQGLNGAPADDELYPTDIGLEDPVEVGETERDDEDEDA